MRNNGKLINWGDVPDLIKQLRNKGEKIVLTTGGFDIVHEGHLEYLYKAKEHGTILIVGVTTDALTKQEKGPDRPIAKQDARAFLVAGFECVDYVVFMDINPDKNAITKMIRPDILIISQSTKKREGRDNFAENMKKLVGDYCGDIVCLPPQAETSTSNMLRDVITTGNAKLLLDLLELLGPVFKRHGYELIPIKDED